MSECMVKVNSEDPNMEDASTTMFMATSNVFEANVASQKVLLIESHFFRLYPANIWLFNVNNKNSRKKCEIRPKLAIKTLKQRHYRHFGVCIVISHLFLLFLLLIFSLF